MQIKVLAGALITTALVTAPALAQPVPQEPQGIVVTLENGVTVYRGTPSPPPVIQASAAPAISVAGGNTLWLVDTDSGKITGCRIFNTADHGRRRLSCTSGRLH